MSLFLLAPPSENDRSKIMEALNEPPEIGNYPSEVTLSKDATDKLIARMRSGAAKEYISKQRKEAPKTATVKRKEPERRQTLAEKKLEIFEEEYKSPSRAFTTKVDGILWHQVLLPGQKPPDAQVDCACPKHGSKNIVDRVMKPSVDKPGDASASDHSAHISSNVKPYPESWVTDAGWRETQKLMIERLKRARSISCYDQTRKLLFVQEVIQNQVCHYHNITRKDSLSMDSLYGVVESIVLFLKSPIPTAGQLIAKDMDETSDMCLLLTYLFADFFLRLEASEEQIKRYKKNFGLIYGTFLSIMDAWSEDMCPALSRKAAKFVRKVEAFSTKHGIELKELDDGMIVAWPKYPSEFETEQSRLLEPGMLPKFMDVFRKKHSSLGGINEVATDEDRAAAMCGGPSYMDYAGIEEDFDDEDDLDDDEELDEADMLEEDYMFDDYLY